MPRIPLYNKGQGPAAQLATGQLSPRADVGAFTAPSQAVARLGGAASDIAFRFGMEERKRQDRTAIKEETRSADDFFATKLIEDQSSSVEEANANFENYRKEYMETLKSKNYGSRRLGLITSSVDAVFAQRSISAKQRAFNRGTELATSADNDALDLALGAISTNPPGSIQHDAALEIAEVTFNDAESENRKLKFDRNSFSLQTKIDRANVGFESATTPAEANAVYQALKDDPTIPPGKLLQAKNLRDSTKTKLATALYDETLEVITEGAFSSSELKQIQDGYNAGEDFTITRPDGQEVGFSVSNMPITRRRQIAAIADKAGSEFDADVRAGIISDMNDGFESEGVDGVMAIATVAVTEAASPEDANEAILGAAHSFAADAALAAADGDYESALELSQVAESLLGNRFLGNPSIREQGGTMGRSANTITKSIAKVRTDVEEAKQEIATTAKISSLIESGTLDNFEGIYTDKEVNTALNQSLAGKPLRRQLDILENNNVTYAPMAGTVNGAASEGLGATPDMTNVMEGLELFRQMKVHGDVVLTNHTDETTRAFFNSVLSLEATGVETEDAIKRVNKSFNTGIDINAKYSTVKSGVDKIEDNQQSTFFGITFSGAKANNRTYLHQTVEDLSKVYIGMGTMSAEDAVKAAIEDINASHINIRGQLIPRRKNYPKDLGRMIDLAADAFVESNPEYEGEDISLIPTQGRIDEWSILINGMPAPYADNPVYSLNDLKGLLNADVETSVDALIQENLENRGLTEMGQLRSEAQRLQREANKLTGDALSKIRREQGDAAAEAAIAERERLLAERQDILDLVNEKSRLERGR